MKLAQPIHCLPTLIRKLSHKTTMDPLSVVNLYKGDDWRKVVSLHPVSLWKNDYMELVIKNWRSGEKYIYRNNFSTVHTKILEGSFYSKMCVDKSDIAFTRYLVTDDHYTFDPFSNVTMTALERSSTIQLYYYHHLY
jgi:hypothetical protein